MAYRFRVLLQDRIADPTDAAERRAETVLVVVVHERCLFLLLLEWFHVAKEVAARIYGSYMAAVVQRGAST